MKKKILFVLVSILILSGCSLGKKDTLSDLKKKVDKCDTYYMKATLEISRNEEKYLYDIESSYKKDDYYKVSLVNKNNDHEQVILKNDNGVYVITPSLNKSFKFQSDWPYNNSQIYLLQPIITDIENDKNSVTEKTKKGYIITSKVNYSTEKDYDKQLVYLDTEGNPYKVEIIDKNKNVKMTLKILDINYKTKFDKNYFDESTYIKQEKQQEDTVSKIDEVVYPMYVPTETYLTSQNVINTINGERAILTFGGETPFTIIQETVDNKEDNYVYGDPYLITDTVGSLTDGLVSWITNGIEYSVISDTMNIDELITVANSISVVALGK